ncbi:alpha-1,4 glucan phosphorylase L-1 isozyme, chloroplastic/amyloplastic-like isoform X2 [Euphorbia lathyris]|uniref:alpha-1,4 glucan phosphorylase L-1 isozyme, chloroplastic/amyloplastic-like isoform X2 n=1 Tax=Euphorbia lathyris TaxID=212925 RepID=UPI00331429C7
MEHPLEQRSNSTLSLTLSISLSLPKLGLTMEKQSDLPKAFVATAQSVRDSLIINWNATYELHEKTNLELSGLYAEALQKLGHNLEDVANQEPDAALGNGGLGRLASCFLDSLATLNYPAWGYGLRYRYGLFKQLNTENGQEEVAENWLEVLHLL